MLNYRPAAERGLTQTSWLQGRHSFSFGRYHDPQHMGFGALRVINDDIVSAAGGFSPHPHDHMEIVTIVFSGALAHKDSSGGQGVIQAGDAQYMSAGSGVVHSEFNASQTEAVHLMQIWVLPNVPDNAPRYAQMRWGDAPKGTWRLISSPNGDDGSMPIYQDAKIWLADLAAGQSLTYDVAPGRQAWLQLATGALVVNAQAMQAGDGVSTTQAGELTLQAKAAGTVVLFDLLQER